jgi:hypothetical protein
MHRKNLRAPLLVAAVTMCLTVAPTEAADDYCTVILPAADRLEAGLNLVSESGTPPYVAGQIRSALSPLYGLPTPSAVDLRIRSDMLASQVDDSDPYRPASPALLAGDLAKARQLLTAARESCTP